MKRFQFTFVVLAALVMLMTQAALASSHIDGVITGYSSGNIGSDLFVRTSDGRKYDFWFDNTQKPVFEGQELPWCPDWPCAGWPSALVLNHTRVRIFLARVSPASTNGKTIESPTEIVILHR